MPKETSQVPQVVASLNRFDKRLLAFCLTELEKRESEPFGAAYSKRSYPGEAEAKSVVDYLQSAARRSNQACGFLKLMRVLQRVEERLEGPRDTLVNTFKTLLPAGEVVGTLSKHLSRRGRAVGISRNGIVFQPTTKRGTAELGVILLAQQWRLTRVRQCHNCEAWFYARFKHQHFCNDQKKKCQWNHYHSPEWRKKHRESNRRHQRSYRKRLFGKKEK